MYGFGKSDEAIVARKLPNKTDAPRVDLWANAAEAVEPRASTKRNADQRSISRTQSRIHEVSQELARVRERAQEDKKTQFTALLHHLSLDRLRQSFYGLQKQAAPGVDGVVWSEYGEDLEANLQSLHTRVQRGTYRAKPSRRVYIPKADGRERPLGVAALEDKIVQGAMTEVLNAIYKADFLGFSYGVPAGTQSARCAGCASGWTDQGKGELGAGCGHSWILRHHQPRVDAKIPSAPDWGSPRFAVD